MSKPITPLLAADAIVQLVDRPECPIVLIERQNPPFGWAIPGGFVDVGESVEHAAVREALEETRLNVRLTVLLGLYSSPNRDPRGHTVTAVYVAESRGDPEAADDAKSIKIVTPDSLPQPLAFDHALVLGDYKRYVDTRQTTPLR